MNAKFKVGDRVVWNEKLVWVENVRKVAGEWYYFLKLHDGYYTDTEGTVRYNSSLIEYEMGVPESSLMAS